MKADVLTKGTQLKMLWYLQGNQRVIFKPKRYDREHVIQGKGKVFIDQVSPDDFSMLELGGYGLRLG